VSGAAPGQSHWADPWRRPGCRGRVAARPTPAIEIREVAPAETRQVQRNRMSRHQQPTWRHRRLHQHQLANRRARRHTQPRPLISTRGTRRAVDLPRASQYHVDRCVPIFIGRYSTPHDLPDRRRSARLNFRLIRGRSAAAGTVHPVPSRLVTHGPDCRRTVANRIGKRVGETLKSSNLLSSASALTRDDRKRAIPLLWVGEVARLNRFLGPCPGRHLWPRPPGQPGGERWHPSDRRGPRRRCGPVRCPRWAG
jgi:hypothetical protein